MVVAHNEQFDRQIIRIMFERLGRGWAFDKPAYDTMEAAAPIVNLPPTPRMVAADIDKPNGVRNFSKMLTKKQGKTLSIWDAFPALTTSAT
ncbi:3'-5' exonuclease family protein [Acetobacter indonesiensis]|uniref:hypothetical protein n=1 Tax=Acetobacter indonesiensis TaxID=104101 RepID=UPI0020A32AAD|nr:hypothetical protein [Acetobacter indonesiensis]MCP1229847.1 hypothetical protein [Acetobacter indonesiensis]